MRNIETVDQDMGPCQSPVGFLIVNPRTSEFTASPPPPGEQGFKPVE